MNSIDLKRLCRNILQIHGEQYVLERVKANAKMLAHVITQNEIDKDYPDAKQDLMAAVTDLLITIEPLKAMLGFETIENIVNAKLIILDGKTALERIGKECF